MQKKVGSPHGVAEQAKCSPQSLSLLQCVDVGMSESYLGDFEAQILMVHAPRPCGYIYPSIRSAEFKGET